MATSTSSLLPINLRRRCWNKGLYSRVRICLRTMPKRFALSSPFSRARSTSCSNAASEACGSKIAAGRARSWRRTSKAESTVPASCFWRNKTNSFFSQQWHQGRLAEDKQNKKKRLRRKQTDRTPKYPVTKVKGGKQNNCNAMERKQKNRV